MNCTRLIHIWVNLEEDTPILQPSKLSRKCERGRSARKGKKQEKGVKGEMKGWSRVVREELVYRRGCKE